jgi:hypothetical protein
VTSPSSSGPLVSTHDRCREWLLTCWTTAGAPPDFEDAIRILVEVFEQDLGPDRGGIDRENTECSRGLTIDGSFCPEIENAPETVEGRYVAAALDRWGLWHRAGMSGQITGIDMGEALAGIPQGSDRDFAQRLFAAAETSFCNAAARNAAGDGKG